MTTKCTIELTVIMDIKTEIIRLLDKTLTECEEIMTERGCDLHEAVRIMMQEKKLHKCPPPGFRCESCGYVDYSIMYASDPPQYKCERYGHLVRITDKCKEKG